MKYRHTRTILVFFALPALLWLAGTAGMAAGAAGGSSQRAEHSQLLGATEQAAVLARAAAQPWLADRPDHRGGHGHGLLGIAPAGHRAAAAPRPAGAQAACCHRDKTETPASAQGPRAPPHLQPA